MESIPRWRNLITSKRWDIVSLILALTLLFYFAVFEIKDPDTWWHLKTGEVIFEKGIIPYYDIFSYTSPGQIWYYIAWLFELLLYIVYLALGFNGLIFLRAIFIVLIFTFVYFASLNRGVKSYLALIVLLVGASASKESWLIRPQLLSYLLVIVFIYILDRFRYRDEKYIFLLPLLMLFWANSHPAFIAGFIVLGIYVLGEGAKFIAKNLFDIDSAMESKKLIVLIGVALISFLVSLINPITYQAILWPLRQVNSVFAENVREMFSPTFSQSPLFWLMFFVSLIAMISAIKRLDLVDIGIFAAFSYLALSASRHVPLFAIAISPILAKYADIDLAKIEAKITSFMRKRGNILTNPAPSTVSLLLSGIFLLSLILAISSPAGWKLGVDKALFPQKAVEFIKSQGIKGNMFNFYDWGGYLIWRLWPEQKVFIDGRTTSVEVFEDYLDIVEAEPSWQELLDKYEVSFIITPSCQSDGEMLPYISGLYLSDLWKLIYYDDNSLLLIRDASSSLPKIKIYEEMTTECNRILAREPNNINAVASLGWAYFMRGDLAKAKIQFERVRRYDPENESIRLIYRKLEEAQADYD